jgi:hypothetical protein
MEAPFKFPLVKPEEGTLSFWDRHRLSLLLILTFILEIIMTTISVIIYNSSGAAQLDLSRPGYLSVSDQVERDDTIDEYSASGPINKDTIQEFITLYDEQAEKAKGVNAFNGDPLNPEVLVFGSPAAQ